MNMFTRTQMLLGKAALDRLAAAHVAVFGVGGVGGYAVEVLARSGVGAIDLIDKDVVDITNLNRQIIALHSTIGEQKVEVARRRILDITPSCRVTTFPIFYLPEVSDDFDLSPYDYVVDCIDTITAKLELIRESAPPADSTHFVDGCRQQDRRYSISCSRLVEDCHRPVGKDSAQETP